MTYVIYVEDGKGDLVDVEYYDGHDCMIQMLEVKGILTMLEAGAGRLWDIERTVTFGKSPCAASDLDQPVFCDWCKKPMNASARQGIT